jgi:hypothetical protein
VFCSTAERYCEEKKALARNRIEGLWEDGGNTRFFIHPRLINGNYSRRK